MNLDDLQVPLDELNEYVTKQIKKVLDKWGDFEDCVVSKAENATYFSSKERNYTAYYKAGNVIKDIEEYWK